MDKFDVVYIPEENVEKLEAEGAVQKIWVQTSEGEALFKDACINPYYSEARTDWPEKIVSELANQINLPTAKYELAQLESSEGLISGSISFKLSNYDGKRRPLEKTLERSIENYNYGSDYSISSVMNILEKQNVQLPPDKSLPEGINNGADMFVGALLLDAYTCNIDRHSRNFDIITNSNEGVTCLSPIFDYGKSFGSFLNDEVKVDRSVSDYSKSAQSSIRVNGYRKNGLEVFAQAAKLRPEAAKIWQNELSKINHQQIQELFDRLPDGIITPTSKEFALDLLEHNQSRLLDLGINRKLANINISQIPIDESRKIINVLSDLVSSAKYVALNEGTLTPNSDIQKVYNFPNGVSIEKDSKSISILYDGRSIKFDQDFNVVKNELKNVEIRQIDELLKEVKQQSLKVIRSQQIQQDIDLER